MRAFHLELTRGSQPFDKIAASKQSILFAIERHKTDGRRFSGTRLRTTEHGRYGTGVVVRSRATAHAIVMRANDCHRTRDFLWQCDNISPMALKVHIISPTFKLRGNPQGSR